MIILFLKFIKSGPSKAWRENTRKHIIYGDAANQIPS